MQKKTNNADFARYFIFKRKRLMISGVPWMTCEAMRRWHATIFFCLPQGTFANITYNERGKKNNLSATAEAFRKTTSVVPTLNGIMVQIHEQRW